MPKPSSISACEIAENQRHARRVRNISAMHTVRRAPTTDELKAALRDQCDTERVTRFQHLLGNTLTVA